MRPRRPAGDWRFWALLGLFAAFLALQLAAPQLDSDQANTGLMGVHILRGEFPIVFWGQHHAGVPESYGAAVAFAVLGVSRRALSLVPALSAVALLLLVYRTGSVLFGRGAGLLAMLFLIIVSPYMAAHYVLARTYYIEQLVLGQVVLLAAALTLARQASAGAPPRPAVSGRLLVGTGLAAGLGFYCGFQIAYALVPGGLALLLLDPRLPRRPVAGLGAAAFLAGSLPLWLYNLTHGWPTFSTAARFQGVQSWSQAAGTIVGDLLPRVLGAADWAAMSLPWSRLGAGVIRAITLAAVGLLVVRTGLALGRLRRDPALAGEALCLLALLTALGMVWAGRFVQVPRYLIPVVPPLALVLARACQLTWYRSRALATGAAALYLAAVGIPLARELTVLWPESRAAHRRAAAGDADLFALLREHGLRHVYALDYWLAPRLAFDALARGEADLVVAEPFRAKYRPYTAAVDASPRPAYVAAGQDIERVRGWIRGIGSRAREADVAGYAVFWDFAEPPATAPLPRTAWTVRTGTGAGRAEAVADGRLDTGWASAPGPAGAAWIEIDLGERRRVSGVTLVTDQPRRIPQTLEVWLADEPAGGVRLLRLDTGAMTAAWRDGAPRFRPSRTVTARFPPMEARRLRLVDAAPAGSWAVAETFLLAPADASRAPVAAAVAGRQLEADGALGPALVQYRAAMRAAPDDPDGYEGFAHLATDAGLRARNPVEQATRYLEVGLLEEARASYSRLAAGLGPGRTHLELTGRQAGLAARAGDDAEADRLGGVLALATVPDLPEPAVFGRRVVLAGAEPRPRRLRPGELLELAYRWRFDGLPGERLVAYVHLRHATGGHRPVQDDHDLPVPLAGLGWPQHVVERRPVRLPADAEPGPYRVVVGIEEPAARRQLRRWWRGLVPTPARTVEVGVVEVVPRS